MTLGLKELHADISQIYGFSFRKRHVKTHPISCYLGAVSSVEYPGLVTKLLHGPESSGRLEDGLCLLSAAYLRLRPFVQDVRKCSDMIVMSMRQEDVVQCLSHGIQYLVYI